MPWRLLSPRRDLALTRRTALTAAALGWALAPRRALADELVLTLGTATAGGGFEQYAAALIAALGERDPELTIAARRTKGGTENVPLLEQGALQLGLVTGEIAHEALATRTAAAPTLSVVTATYATAGMFVMRADAPHRRIADLTGKRVIFGARGSGLVVLARHVLEALGLDMTRDFDAVLLDRVAEAPAMLLDGSAAALWGGGRGWPAFAAVAHSTTGARFIAPNTDEIGRILTRWPFLRRIVLPAGSYPGQNAQIESVGSWGFILGGPALNEAAGYRFAKTLHAAERTLGARLPQATETTAANTVAAVPRPDLLHPGVARYLREARLLR